MDYSEFSEIVQASNHVHKLVFDGLTLLKRGTIDFGKNIDYKIKQLSLQNTGDEEYSDWRQDNNEFSQIVKQILESYMSFSLKVFNIHRCNVDIDHFELSEVDF